MITKITMNQVASYKGPAILETDKKINLIYGLNGTGKSTLSDYLYDMNKSCFKNCSVEGYNNEEILVYNQSFIKDYFYEPDNLKGIFTLSKENKDAKEKIKNAKTELTKNEYEKKSKTESIDKLKNEISQKKQNAENTIWEIKNLYSGGDRVLEYCLTGLMGRKESLFDHISSITKPPERPIKKTDQLKKEIEAIQGKTAQKYDLLPKIDFVVQEVEINPLFQKIIIGNENSTVSNLIKTLGNSDWVKKGLEYIPKEINKTPESCPFCQEKSITKTLVENIRNYFNKTYESHISELEKLSSNYDSKINSLHKKETYESNPFIIEKKLEFKNLFNAILLCLNNNKQQIIDKLKSPSQSVNLKNSKDAITNFNLFIEDINKNIKTHNNKIDNKEQSLADIKSQFWNIMRFNYDQTLSTYQIEKNATDEKIKKLNEEIQKINVIISNQQKIIVEQQKMTVNIDAAIAKINSDLLDLGIDGFEIVKHSDVLYKIERTEQCDNTFQTLSEGEKMIISFLYFRELCKGKKTAMSHSDKKIVIIDDPISSLSHVYIFNVGQLIKCDFFNSAEYEQVFLLTHSLYFFYEMTDAKHDRRKETQQLFRMGKNSSGSFISTMKYDEIQNDYHSYWYIVKDSDQPAALIANCMRNIIEYFFNFIEKKDFNNVFQKSVLQATKYQAFRRYVNRESHSLGQNIFDYKEFNYNDFKDALRLVFVENGYKEHYEEMIK